MTPLKLEKFGGMLPAWSDKLLPEGQAALAINCYLFSGELTGWRRPKLLRALTNSAARSVYRVPTISQATAGATLKFITNVNEGDTVKVGEETYRFTATVIPGNYDVLLGGTATVSATNLFAALTLAAGAGTLYSIAIVANEAISQVAGVNTQSTHDFGSGSIPIISLLAPDFGEAFNTTTVTESTGGVRVAWIKTVAGNVSATTFTGGANQTFDSTITGAATWLEFLDRDTDVMRSPVVNDTFSRYYFASPSLPPKYNTYDRIVASDPAWLLGVPAPGCAPTVSASGGGTNILVGNPGADDPPILNTPSSLIPANSLFLMPFTASANGLLTSVALFPDNDGIPPFDQLLGCVYSDSGGEPHIELGVAVGPTGGVQQGWIAGTALGMIFGTPVPIVADTKYWIGFKNNANIAVGVYGTGSTGRIRSETFSNPDPSPVSGMSATSNLQIWGRVTSGAVQAARAYTYTYVTAYGEEGPPAPPTVVNGWSNGTWTIGLFQPPADEMGVTRNITKKRLYRTISNEKGLATYFFVAELDVATDTYSDAITDDVVALNSILESTLWFPPPEGLEGIASMPNGMTVGFKGNELWFAEQYRPHAWPPSYIMTTDFPIVGIGVIGQSVVVCTSGRPYVATGASPGSMSLVKTDTPEPCNSRGSVLAVDDGVLYTSPNGLIKVTQYGKVSNTTELWITRERWRTLTPLKATHAIQIASSYFAFGTVDGVDTSVAQQGYTIELNSHDAFSFDGTLQPGGHRLGFNQMTAPGSLDIYNVQVDPWTGIGLLIQNSNVYYYDFADTAPEIMPYKWRSKIFQRHAKANFEAMKAWFYTPAGTPTQSTTRNVSATQPTLAADQYGIIRVYADGLLVTTRELRSSGELLRILSGYKREDWQWEIEGRVPVTNLQAATSVRDLGDV